VRRAPARLVAVLVLSAASLVAPLGAQGGARSIAGRVTRPVAGAGESPVGGAWVVLHRVGPDSAGPLDSLRTGADGRYVFRYRAFGDTNAVYFVSTNRGGVNYFTSPVREVAVRDGIAEILVYDTTSAAIPIAVRGRHLIVTAADTGSDRRRVIEAYELSNDTTVTRVAAGPEGFTFEAPLPAGVSVVAPGQGDISEDAIRVVDGRVRVTAPLSPGVRQFSFSYDVPVDAPFTVLVANATPVVEVLLEDARGEAVGAGLAASDPVEVEGRPFRRFLAEDVPAAQTIRITMPVGAAARSRRVGLVVAFVAAFLAMGLALWVPRLGRTSRGRREDDPEALALAVAALDAEFERIASPSEEQRATHYLERARLKGRLTAALAKRNGLA
jgi:hypothetical protein